MFLLCKHVRLTCVFNKLMMMMYFVWLDTFLTATVIVTATSGSDVKDVCEDLMSADDPGAVWGKSTISCFCLVSAGALLWLADRTTCHADNRQQCPSINHLLSQCARHVVGRLMADRPAWPGRRGRRVCPPRATALSPGCLSAACR